ncbi:MAG TPA: benzoate-CoA ligase family protein [Pyrinomonadaceae bacterium]|nr:benzoate-CoA ligase family protein [Pyrinomonadaceae bacterium]
MNLFTSIFTAERLERPAILFEHRTISYAELRAETLRVAALLSAHGIAPGDRVAMLLADSPEFIAAFVAVIFLGGVAVPVNLALRREEQLFILNDCGARVAIVEASIAPALFENAKAPAGLTSLIVVSRVAEQLPEIAGVRVQDFAAADEDVATSAALSYGRAADTDRDAFILYTSGSTGEPKGAVHTEAHIFYTNETYCREVLKLEVADRLFSSSRLPFAYGLGNAFTFPLLNGCTAILCREKPAPEVIAQVFENYRPTIFFGVPVVYRMLLERFGTGARHGSSLPGSSHAGGTLNTSSLRLCISAGEALPAHLGQAWEDTFGVQVLDGIGSTEMLHMFMSNHDGELRYGSSGRLLAGYDARLLDHEGRDVPSAAAGNLWIRGGSAASRYWQRTEVSAQTFVDDWVRTGDLYRCDGEGFWWHMGRSDDCFKASGQWVSPIEVEGVLLRSDSVRSAAVVEGRDASGLSCVCAFLVPAGDCDPHLAETNARALCETALPRFKQPRRYIFVAELPYTATGKLQRFKLREQLRSDLP